VAILDDLRRARVRTVPVLREIRRKWSKEYASTPAEDVRRTANEILDKGDPEFRFVAYEIIYFHKPARLSLRAQDVERLAHGMQSWDAVDAFSYYISGPAWRDGQISDATITKWTRSKDRWWRRASLASTIPLSRRHSPEKRDIERVLALCTSLVSDRDDMVVKAMSWAVREVARQNPKAAKDFINAHRAALAPRVLREVNNKLKTGLKNPKGQSAVTTSRHR
jgi:3-methyladenine DNA glycosylase AlkD